MTPTSSLCRMALALAALSAVAACTVDGDTLYQEVEAPSLTMDAMRSDLITMHATGSQVEFSWPRLQGGLKMDVTVTRDGRPFTRQTFATGVSSFRQQEVETNVEYAYLFRLTDGTRMSDGVAKTYTRRGASAITTLCLTQRDASQGYELHVAWDTPTDADLLRLTASCPERDEIAEELAGDASCFVVPDVREGEEWTVSVTACNAQGDALPATASLKVGRTAVAFLSPYATPDELLDEGDDDEAAAWLWFHSEYPGSRFLYAGDIASAADLEPLRVLFYIRDLDRGTEADVWRQPAAVEQALPHITEWYRAGGNLLLWQHACTLVGDLGRVPKTLLQQNDRRITVGPGQYNGDRWYMAVHANLAGRYYIDFSQHPIYRGVPVNADGTITVKGPCWTEDHNCCFFNIPALLTGGHNQSADTYWRLTKELGIYPLATWDNEQMQFVSQLNVWEARQGDTDLQGTVLCVGNGGLEFSHQSPSGEPDKSARPTHNPYQGHVLLIARNAIEYLKTR